jgi:hypothetical protein
MLNIDQIAALRSKVERGEFTDLEAFLKCVMHMFRTSFDADLQLILERMGLAKEAAHLAERRRETKDRHRSWINHVMEKYNLVIRSPEGIEKKRHEYATSAAFDRWFRTIGPYLEGVHVDNIYNADEIGIEVSHNLKVICTPEQRVFRQEEEKSAHLTVMLCVNRRGEGPIPMVVVPNLASCRREFRAIHGSDAHLTTSPSGWVDGEGWIEFARLFCECVDSRRRTRESTDEPVALFVDNAPTRSNVEALRIFRDHNVRLLTFVPHATHVQQPIDVVIARALKAWLRRALAAFSEDGVLALLFQLIGLTIECASRAQKRRVAVVAAIVESVQVIRRWSLTMNAFLICGLVPFCRANLSRHYIRDDDEDPEWNAQLLHPDRLTTSSRNLTSDAYLGRVLAHSRAKLRLGPVDIAADGGLAIHAGGAVEPAAVERPPALSEADWEIMRRAFPTPARRPVVRGGKRAARVPPAQDPDDDLTTPMDQAFMVRLGEADRFTPPLDIDGAGAIWMDEMRTGAVLLPLLHAGRPRGPADREEGRGPA